MYRRLTHYSIIVGMICLLSACGFQLRGAGTGGTALPEAWKSMYLVTNDPNSEFTRDVSALFSATGVIWADDRVSANFILVLQPERFEQRNLSLNSQARVAEYELIMRAQFSVLNADNKEEIPPTTVSVVKRMQNDPDNVTGKASELQLLKVESRRELAQQILQRTSFYAAASQANNP